MADGRDPGRRRRPERTARGVQLRYGALGPVENPYPPFDVLSEEGLHRIVHSAYRLLEEAGLEFRSQRALAILKSHGASVDFGTQMVRLDRALVEHYVGLAPSKFPVRARNPERDTVMGTNRINFNTVGSPPNVSDLERGRRSGTYRGFCAISSNSITRWESSIWPGERSSSRSICRYRHGIWTTSTPAALYRPADHRANRQPVPRRGRDRHGGDRARA